MERKPNETAEQFEKRKALVAKLSKFATDGKPRTSPTALIRLIVLFVIGLILVIVGLNGHGDAGNGATTQGLATQYLGPHGNDIASIIIGLLIMAPTAYFITKRLREMPPRKAL